MQSKKLKDKCISKWLMHVATWYHRTPSKVHQIRGTRVHSRTLSMPNFVVLWQTVQDTQQNRWPAMHQCASSCQISSHSGVREKHYIFLHPTLFWCPRGTTWAKVHQSWWCIARPSLLSCHISSHSGNPSVRCLVPKFVNFVDGMTSTHTKKQTLDDTFPHTSTIRWQKLQT